MGMPDLSAIFDILDPVGNGYLVLEQIRQFHQTLNFTPISKQHVQAAILEICQSKDDKVYKEYFAQVLRELDRRRQVEEHAHWEFELLDCNGNNRISLKDALFLFKVTHGEKFSLHTWKQFLASRSTSQHKDVCFDEIKMWLCNRPSGEPCTSNEYQSAEEELEQRQREEDRAEFENTKKLGEDEYSLATEARERENYREQTLKQARRKLNKWQKEGLKGLLHDDGLDRYDDEGPQRERHSVSINELLDALDYKYDRLRDMLFWTMLKMHIGDALWSSMSESEHLEQFQHLKVREKQLRKDNQLEAMAHQLHGGQTTQDATLLMIMGETDSKHAAHVVEIDRRRMDLVAEGKLQDQIHDILEREYRQSLEVGPTTSAHLLVSLHARYTQERERLLELAKPNKDGHISSSLLLLEYCKLLRQHSILGEEEPWAISALAVGLAERKQQADAENGFDVDHSRQEALADERIKLGKGRKSQKVAETSADPWKGRSPGVVDLQVETVAELSKKHFKEREMMLQMLQGKQAESYKMEAKKFSTIERKKRLTILRSQRDSWSRSTAEYRSSQHAVLVNILHEGVAIYREDTRSELSARRDDLEDEDRMNGILLARLQLEQDEEFWRIIAEMQHRTSEEINKMRKHERKARIEEHYDNIATLVLGTFEASKEEKEYIAALEEKYEALRDRLLVFALKLQHQEEWKEFTTEDKTRLLVKHRQEEKRLRQEGKVDDMAAFLGQAARELKLRALLGESREEFASRLETQFEEYEKRVLQGLPEPDEEPDEEPEAESKVSNPLAELQQRFFNEQHALIHWLRADGQNLSLRRRLLHLLSLKRETYLIKKEDDFRRSALVLGLVERSQEAREKRHKSDRERQQHLARLRVENRQIIIDRGEKIAKELDDHVRPDKNDLQAMQAAYMMEMDKKHSEEREILLKILMDPGLADLLEVADTMPDDEKQKRLTELQGKKRRLDLNSLSDREEHVCVLEEAAALRSVIKRRYLQEQTTTGGEVGHDEVTRRLLAELQDEQDRESATVLYSLTQKDADDLEIGHRLEIRARHQGAAENVFLVLTRYEGTSPDDELLKAIEDKYDTLRDKLLMELLMKQMGEAEWASLSEKERQRRLMQLKLQEKKLRREGKEDELQKLFGDLLQQEENLRKLMGDNKAEYDRKLRERLARRQKRIEQGLDPDEDEDGDGLDEEESGQGDPLSDLNSRMEEEKRALLARLHGLNDEYLSERERQAELVRLRREAKRAGKEENFQNAALLIGLAERNQATLAERLKNDRQRQEQLARERLEALRRRRAQGKLGEDDSEDKIVTEGDRTVLQEAVLNLLEKKHAKEREQFLQMMEDKTNQELRLLAEASSEEERKEKLAELMKEREALRPDDKDSNNKILRDGTMVKIESSRISIGRESGAGQVSDEEVHTSLMADLQERQDQEASDILTKFSNTSDADLVTMQESIALEKKQDKGENIARVLFHSKTGGGKAKESDLLEALDGKYEELRNKLLMEALVQQVGEAEWKNMSEQERQRRMMQLRLEERRLRKEGKLDEASALLGEALKNKETLEKLMGDSRAEQKQKLRERLERRRQRLADGMSEEEAKKLEQEEIAQEEEEEKKRRNVLLDLEHRYDKEKEELLNRLRGMGDKNSAERARQLELARLRREMRKAKQEEQFDAAAIALGLAVQGEKAKEQERLRQEKLAKERIAARRKKGQQKGEETTPGQEEEVPLPENEKDPILMHEAVVKEMELKHAKERELLLQMLQDINSDRRQEAKEASEEDRQDKLEELRELRQQWRTGGATNPDDQMELFRDAIPVRLESKLSQLAAEGKPSIDEDGEVAMLADLQQRQDIEATSVIEELSTKSPEAMKQMKMVQAMARQQQWNDNLATVLLGDKGEQEVPPSISSGGAAVMSEEERELVQALEKKYDAVKDKLLLEGLMKQYGEAEWANLTERERQSKLMKIKLQERKLRIQGKEDEALALINQLMEAEKGFQKKYGDSKEEQERKFRERLERKRQLVAQRQAEGLETDDATLEGIIEEEEAREVEEENKKRKNILNGLQMSLEAEKQALLASLRNQDDRYAAEKQRQLELAKLRREKKRLQQEDKLDTATILISMAKQQEKDREKNFVTERDRQKAIAKQRLEARRKKKQEEKAEEAERDRKQIEDKLKLEEAENKMKDMLAEVSGGGTAALQDSLLAEAEQKQQAERDVLMQLMQAAEQDPGWEAAGGMSVEDLKANLEKVRQDRMKWRSKCRQTALESREADMMEAEKEQYLTEVAQSRSEQFKLLTTAMVFRLQAEYKTILEKNPNVSPERVKEDISIALLADLQQKQNAENNALGKIILEQDDSMLIKVQQSQRRAKREAWMDNLTNSLFTMLPEMEPNRGWEEKKLQDLEKEFEKEKEEVEKKKQAGEEVDADAILKELEAQYAAKRKAMNEALDRQREMYLKKLEARREAKENQEYEADAALAMLEVAQRQDSLIKEKQDQERDRQGGKMQSLLAARREARRKAEEEEEERRRREATMSLPGSGLRREKTAFDVAISDDQKQAQVQKLVRDQAKVQQRYLQEQSRFSEKLKAQLEERKHKRENEAEALMRLGERQKTILETRKNQDRERQIAMMKERIERVKYERTRTMKEKSDRHVKQFSDLVNDQDVQDMTEDERMELAAQKMQEKFLAEESEAKEGKKTLLTPEEVDEKEPLEKEARPKTSSMEERMSMLKEKRRKRKKKRAEEGATGEEVEEEELVSEV
ncbi:trichohyalin [Lingula anatina]|uniref:Trichohyalin n=1 Tax=Lingula anatina TaxID=7574 RepID=A0A1S3JFD3_LINAN|nr:trichohyalin [Lingula anatina]|eukprot:XP_013408861.1 trichohyalin [Lingula anatina]